MSCAPALLKFLGIKLALELTKAKEYSEQRLFQAIIVQALEDAVNTSTMKKETYYKYDSHVWFVNNSEEFKDICWGADMDPDFVRGEYLKLVDSQKIFFSKLQLSWIRYRELYRKYRNASSKEERRYIKTLILKENLKRLSQLLSSWGKSQRAKNDEKPPEDILTKFICVLNTG